MQYAIAGVTRNSFGDLTVCAELTDVRDVLGIGMDSVPSDLALDLYLESVADNGGSWTSYLESSVTVTGVPVGREVLYIVQDCCGELTEVVLLR